MKKVERATGKIILAIFFILAGCFSILALIYGELYSGCIFPVICIVYGIFSLWDGLKRKARYRNCKRMGVCGNGIYLGQHVSFGGRHYKLRFYYMCVEFRGEDGNCYRCRIRTAMAPNSHYRKGDRVALVIYDKYAILAQ